MAKDSFIEISVNQKEFHNLLKSQEQMHDALTPRWLKNTQRKKAEPMIGDMKRNSHSVRLIPMIGVTTAKKRAGDLGIKVGVIKNDPSKFPEFSAPALASVIEYGTGERYRQLKAAGFISGRASTGSMPAAPFLRPAWDRHVRSVMGEVEQAIEHKVLKQ